MSGAGIPALGRNRLATPLRQVDVVPTLFEHLGVSTQGLALDGRSRLHPVPRTFAFGQNLLANPGAEYGAAHPTWPTTRTSPAGPRAGCRR